MNVLAVTLVFVLLVWLVLSCLVAGLGAFVRRSFGLRTDGAESFFMSFWMGCALLVALIQLWNLWFPVDGRIFVGLLLLGAVGLLWSVRDLLDGIKRALRARPLMWLTLLVFWVWIADRAIGPHLNYDSGLYHFSAVRWAATYPTVPGLVHLHGRLGFNSSYFPYVAFFEVGPFAGKSHHLANGLPFLILFTQLFIIAWKTLATRDASKMDGVFSLLLLGALVRQVMTPNISSPSPDLLIFILGVVLCVQLLSLLTGSGRSKEEDGCRIFVIVAVSILGATIKLSFLAFGATASLLAIAFSLTARCRRTGVLSSITMTWIAVYAALAIVPYMARGVILSGYISYPLNVGSLPVDWRVYRSKVIGEAKWIRSWARQRDRLPDEVLNSWDWLGPWFRRTISRENWFDVVIPMGLALGGALFAVARRLIQGKRSRGAPAEWMFLLPPLAGLGFWFWTAPDPRFAGAVFWVLGAGSLALAITGWESLRGHTRWRMTVGLSLVLFLFPLRHFGTLWVAPGTDYGFHDTPSRVPLKEFVTSSGLIVYTPQAGDQCWDAQLPCTPYLSDSLCLRDEEDMSRGFTLCN